MRISRICCVSALLASFWSQPLARAESTLRIAMTASDIPTTTGLPNNGFEGMRFLGYPIFEGLVLWDLTSTDRLAGLRPGLAESWEQERQQDLDFPPATGREIPRRDCFQRRHRHLESRPLFQERQSSIRDCEFGDDARPGAAGGLVEEDR